MALTAGATKRRLEARVKKILENCMLRMRMRWFEWFEWRIFRVDEWAVADGLRRQGCLGFYSPWILDLGPVIFNFSFSVQVGCHECCVAPLASFAIWETT